MKLKMSPLTFIVEFICVIFSTLLIGFAFWSASAYCWSKFEWSPFGYETCGLESIVWIAIYPMYLISIFIKYMLYRGFGYPKWWFRLCIVMMLIASIPEKSLVTGALPLIFIVVDVVSTLYVVVRREIIINSR